MKKKARFREAKYVFLQMAGEERMVDRCEMGIPISQELHRKKSIFKQCGYMAPGVYDSSSTASSTMGLRLEIFSAVSSETT